MSFLYPRTVSIRRQNADAPGAAGIQPYAGNTPDNESVIATGLPASIQLKRERTKPEAGAPSDAYVRTGWNVFVRASDRTLITERDVVVDDLGKRYQIIAGYWNSLGYNASAELLEA